MQVHKVASASISEFAYDNSGECLYIRFVNDKIYEFKNVPFVVYSGFKNSSSKGTYFNKHIRNTYKYRQVVSYPDDYTLLARKGDYVFTFTCKNGDEGKEIRLKYLGNEHSEEFIIKLADRSPRIPYWVMLQIKGSNLLVEAIQALFRENDIKSGIITWNGIGLDIKKIDEVSEQSAKHAVNYAEQQTRREERVKMAKRRFGLLHD